MDAVEQLVNHLGRCRLRLVLAESCTAGLVAASIAHVPGVSEWFCGSAVVYQAETKVAWLGVTPAAIADHTAVSAVVAEQMVRGVLRETPHADLAAAITGHLGPAAPAGFDGLVFIGVARRQPEQVAIEQHQLVTQSRIDRQSEAAKLVIESLLKQF